MIFCVYDRYRYIIVIIFPREKNKSLREDFQVSARETSWVPGKKSGKVPVKKEKSPWKFLWNHMREKNFSVPEKK